MVGVTQFVAHLPEIITAAGKDSQTRGALLICLAYLLAAPLLRGAPWPARLGVVVLFLAAGLFISGAGGGAIAATIPAGEVHDEANKGVVGAIVTLIPAATPVTVSTDNNGVYRFDRFDSSEHSTPMLRVTHPDFETYVSNVPLGSVGAFQHVKLDRKPPPSKPPVPPKPKLITLSGKVLDVDGNPIENAEVKVETADNPPISATTSTHDGGLYVIQKFRADPSRIVTITVQAKGYRKVIRTILPSDQVEEIRLQSATQQPAASNRRNVSLTAARGGA